MCNLSLAFDAPAGGGDGGGEKPAAESGRLDIRHFNVVESLSQPFIIHILALSPSADLDPGDYVGRDVSFSIDTR